jgi:NDP-sugar pyrophosphorylase family protein
VREFVPAAQTAGKRLFHFPGIYFIEQSAAARLPSYEKSPSILDELWYPLAAEGRLGAWKYDGAYHDLGTAQDLERAELEIRAGKFPTSSRHE